MRILYNRASADADGKPWSERKRYVWWDARRRASGRASATRRTSRPTKAPDLRARARARRGWTRSRGDKPFIVQADGRGWLYAPTGLVDGPLPAHYEPQESPFVNPALRPAAEPDPPASSSGPQNPYHPSDGERGAGVFPFVLTTYRLTEHHTAGGMSRTVPYLAELQPEFFCEVSPELAAERAASSTAAGRRS